MLQIPLDAQVSADQRFRVELSGQMVKLRFKWNERVGFWFILVSDDFDQQLGELKAVPNWPLCNQYKGFKPFVGDLILLPIDDAAVWPPAYADLGVRWFLFWLSEDEVGQWRRRNGVG